MSYVLCGDVTEQDLAAQKWGEALETGLADSLAQDLGPPVMGCGVGSPPSLPRRQRGRGPT